MTRPGRYPQELRERAVRMVFEHQDEHASQWAAIKSYSGVTYSQYLFNGIDGSGPRDANGFPLPVASGQSGNLGIGITLTIPANSVAYITAEIA